MLFFSRDLGIDLGTSNVLIYAAGRGIVLREPSVIALDKNSGKVLQVGAAARSMLGARPAMSSPCTRCRTASSPTMSSRPAC